MYFVPSTAYAQSAISLSISPPIFEVMIKPGKEVRQVYAISNLGGDTVLTPKIVYFVPSDENGNVDLTDSPAPEWVKYDKTPFAIKNQQKNDFTVMISPPEDTIETDHFLTLVFETNTPSDILGQNSSLYKAGIGGNIILTISKDGNPKKSAEIKEFKAPKIIDSLFGRINYSVILTNNGNSFWKPIGKINVKGINLDKNLTLAPLNIVSGYSRKIPCINNEELIDCNPQSRFYIGKITSNLEFSVDNEPKIYKSEITTFAFPFSLLGIILTLLTIYKNRHIFKVWRKRK